MRSFLLKNHVGGADNLTVFSQEPINASAFVAEQLAWRSLLVDQLLALPFRLQSKTIASQYTKMCDVRFVSIPGFVWCHFDGGVWEAVPNFDYGLEGFWPPLMVESRGN